MDPTKQRAAASAASGGTSTAPGTGSAAGSASGPVGGSSAPSANRGSPALVAAVVPKQLAANGLSPVFNSKGAPPPQTSIPAGGKAQSDWQKGYSSIQLWTPRSQRPPGTDAKQAAIPSREPREMSVEPAQQVGRSPSASLSMSPRCYPSMGMHSANSIPTATIGASSAMMPKLSGWQR